MHWEEALQILQYVRSSSGLDITFQRFEGLQVDIFADADYASKVTGTRSVSRGVVMCGRSAS